MSMDLPKISIVTPSFNQGRFLEEAIQSVLTQGYPNLEYVIIDGGSSDNSIEIIKEYENNLHFWVSEKDKGHGDAINKGFSHTSGEIMAWLNSDDKYTPWSFKIVSDIFRQFPHVNWIMGFNSSWNSDGAMMDAERNPKNIYDFLLGNYAWIQQESVFWRRSLWEKAGGYVSQSFKFMIDGELWTRFFINENLYTVDCILGGYRFHTNNRARHNYQACLVEMERAIFTMKQKCSPDILRNYYKLNTVNYINKVPLFKFIPITAMSREFICPAVFKEASYKNIFYDCESEKWSERSLAFSP